MGSDYDYTTGDGQKRMMAESMGLDSETYITRKSIDVTKDDDHGCDPIGDEMFRMVPSGDIVNLEEMRKRLKKCG